MSEKKKGLTYAEAGVDIDAGEKEVELIKESVAATYTDGVLGDLGGFGGLYTLKYENEKWKNRCSFPERTASVRSCASPSIWASIRPSARTAWP